jgi:hypothetical protein
MPDKSREGSRQALEERILGRWRCQMDRRVIRIFGILPFGHRTTRIPGLIAPNP